jgi:cysteinyl-tRNA synthetase
LPPQTVLNFKGSKRWLFVKLATQILIMRSSLKVYNSLSGQKEPFEPLNPPFVGMYVCGPTVYNEVHLGNCRTFTTFDIIYRYLSFLGYKVRYVRNITDVGHLTDDSDEGEDKIAKRARLESLEPMEIVQKYTNGFHRVMDELNNLPPSIEPTATGHLIEQIEIIKELIANGSAYVSNGSVYFDVKKFDQSHGYGKLSGRVIDELLSGTRDLDGQDEKKFALDFALWKKASPAHIMRWPSEWSEGFPGWHIECSAMSTKYLGKTFDIHGGGMDLKFPHHECEIAQATAANRCAPVRYWLHSNMLTLNGTKMSKSLGNSVLPAELFAGSHPLLEDAFSPMTLRFAMLQTHYRSTMDLSNAALKAAQKGYRKLINGLVVAKKITFAPSQTDSKQVESTQKIIASIFEGLNDDFNTAKAIASLFELLKKINSCFLGQIPSGAFGETLFQEMNQTYIAVVEQILGLKEERPQNLSKAIDFALESYKSAKSEKDYPKVDQIRGFFKEMGLTLMDMKSGVGWAYSED